MDPTNQSSLERALANTYQRLDGRTGWVRVQEYWRVRSYASEHPNKGSQAVATALDLPRSRIRSWVDADGRPDPMRAIETARERGWLDLAWRGPTLAALNVLVAWVYSGGSIAREVYQPRLSVTPRTRPTLEAAFDHLGLTPVDVERDLPERGDEVAPDTDGSVLGRLLAVLGAPVGPVAQETALDLPAYLDAPAAPYALRCDFARTYIRNRGTRRPARPNRPVQFREVRSEAYRERLRSFLRDVVGDEAVIRGGRGSETTYLTPAAAAILCVPPTFGEQLPGVEC